MGGKLTFGPEVGAPPRLRCDVFGLRVPPLRYSRRSLFQLSHHLRSLCKSVFRSALARDAMFVRGVCSQAPLAPPFEQPMYRGDSGNNPDPQSRAPSADVKQNINLCFVYFSSFNHFFFYTKSTLPIVSLYSAAPLSKVMIDSFILHMSSR